MSRNQFPSSNAPHSPLGILTPTSEEKRLAIIRVYITPIVFQQTDLPPLGDELLFVKHYLSQAEPGAYFRAHYKGKTLRYYATDTNKHYTLQYNYLKLNLPPFIFLLKQRDTVGIGRYGRVKNLIPITLFDQSATSTADPQENSKLVLKIFNNPLKKDFADTIKLANDCHALDTKERSGFSEMEGKEHEALGDVEKEYCNGFFLIYDAHSFKATRYSNTLIPLAAATEAKEVAVLNAYDCTLSTVLHDASILSAQQKNTLYLEIIKTVHLWHIGKAFKTGEPMLHVDIKPDNILIKRHGENIIVALGDLDSAAPPEKKFFMLPGTGLFHAPELKQQKNSFFHTDKSNNYALGLTLQYTIEILCTENADYRRDLLLLTRLLLCPDPEGRVDLRVMIFILTITYYRYFPENNTHPSTDIEKLYFLFSSALVKLLSKFNNERASTIGVQIVLIRRMQIIEFKNTLEIAKLIHALNVLYALHKAFLSLDESNANTKETAQLFSERIFTHPTLSKLFFYFFYKKFFQAPTDFAIATEFSEEENLVKLSKLVCIYDEENKPPKEQGQAVDCFDFLVPAQEDRVMQKKVLLNRQRTTLFTLFTQNERPTAKIDSLLRNLGVT